MGYSYFYKPYSEGNLESKVSLIDLRTAVSIENTPSPIGTVEIGAALTLLSSGGHWGWGDRVTFEQAHEL